MQLCSPSLPVGAFAYSQGLESVVEHQLVIDANSCEQWLRDTLRFSLQQTDIPLLSKLYQAWQQKNMANVEYWTDVLKAQRETRELREEDQQLGLALARLLDDLHLDGASEWRGNKQSSFLTLFSLAAVRWEIPLTEACSGYLWSWLDNQIAAAIKLVPLGQTDGQRILSTLITDIPEIVEKGLQLDEANIGASLPKLAILSAQHETQYSRLFRS